MKCIPTSELKRHTSKSLLLILTGILAILIGIGLGAWSNWPASVPVSIRVDGVAEAVSQDVQKGSVLNQLRFYPTASVEYGGRAERVTLPDFYVDRDLAEGEIGQMREIYVDKETLRPVEQKPFQPAFLLPLFLGMIDLSVGLVRMYRYSDYRRLDRLMRSPRQSFVRRGAI